MSRVRPRFMLRVLAVAFALWGVVGAPAQTLVDFGAMWRYLADGSDQGSAWRGTGFSDAGWPEGPAELGYGDGGEATSVYCGPSHPTCNTGNYITTYFRHSFNVADHTIFTGLTLNHVRDDGIVVYLNGTEVLRDNMPGGTITHTTLASSAISGAAESQVNTATISPAPLVTGTNVIAVEIHQSGSSSSDISFDLQLLGSTGGPAVNVLRGPYLQLGTSDSIVVRWRTDTSHIGRVRYGSAPGGLTSFVDEPTADTAAPYDHGVTLTGLSPNTIYYYSIGTPAATVAGDDANHFFRTHPPAGTVMPFRVWVLGDSGTNTANQAAVRNAYYTYAGATHTHLWLMLGDNAYNTGTDAEYQNGVFGVANAYPAMLRKSVLWATRGNHDTGTPYLDIFTFPTAGEAGGIASGTEEYYSFDYGNVHFVCLNSENQDRTTTGPMYLWAQSDINSTAQDWVVVFFHHPPYSKGSHDSDNAGDSGGRMQDMRQNFLPMLESIGVDLVLTGHSHSYERSYLLNGHYGLSGTFVLGTHALNSGDGRPSGNGAYMKATIGTGPNEGAVYACAGSSGQASGGALNHPANFISLNQLGSLVLDFNGNRLDATFLRETGATPDTFTIIKGPLGSPTPSPTPSPTRTPTASPSATPNGVRDGAVYQ